MSPADVVEEPVVDLARRWWARALFDSWVQERTLRRRVRLEVNEWLTVLGMVQRGMGVAYGPATCLDHATFPGVATATLAGAPVWELGVIARDETLRGAAGRAFLAAYLDRCRLRHVPPHPPARAGRHQARPQSHRRHRRRCRTAGARGRRRVLRP